MAARDAGEVLFFCGAGVSFAKAKLPNFVHLAQTVADTLGSSQGGDVRKLLKAAEPPKDGSKAWATVSMDRVFTLLQQEFEVSDVRRAVANALRPPADCDFSAHRILLELSRTRTGQARLVTTNFDRLFELAELGLACAAPPRLPDPRRPADFHGVVHLHGVVNESYAGAEHDEFVLSSGEFGHAYLSDGWATRYIQALLERFVIVFVGYSADDPPVQYLLEAMNAGPTETPRLYAFHYGSAQSAAAQWLHRGVTPIPFDTYPALWQTLEAWSDRARDVEEWHQSVIDRAKHGPAALSAHERGLVTHLARSVEGARAMARQDPTLPAEWLFVFDRAMRYSTPTRWDMTHGETDPFDVLGLDDDAPPERVEVQDPYARRKVPSESWDAFDLTSEDQQGLASVGLAALVGPGASTVGVLPERLDYLSQWFARVAHQPAAVAWLAGRGGVHPQLRAAVTWRLRHQAELFSEDLREAWQRVLQAETVDSGPLRHAIAADVQRAGWSARLIRSAVSLYRPHVLVRAGTAAPWAELSPDIALNALIRAEVAYPEPYAPFAFPVEHLALVCRIFRAHIELAVQLEAELKESGALYFDAIRPMESERRHAYRLTALMGTFATCVEALGKSSPADAQREVDTWAAHADAAFTHLRVWACGFPALTSIERALEILRGLDVDVFWSTANERDLLFAIRDRWPEWSVEQRKVLEWRIVEEPLPWFEDRDDREDVVAHYRLNRLQWMKEQGLTFSFDDAKVMAELRVSSPTWVESAASYTAQPRTMGLRRVVDDSDDELLRDVPLADLVAAASHLEGYDRGRGARVHPFAGLSRMRPARALRALGWAAGQGVDLTPAWSLFLNRQVQSHPPARMRTQVARRLSQLPKEILEAIAHPVAEWMRRFGPDLMATHRTLFSTLLHRLRDVLASALEERRIQSLDWLSEAINRPAGKLTDLLFHDPRLDQRGAESSLPKDWRDHLESLLALPVPAGHHALAVTSSRFTWLSVVDPVWVDQYLLPRMMAGGDTAEAFWSGFLSSGRTPPGAAYTKIKAGLLERATIASGTERYRRTVAGMLLIGWRGADLDQPEVQHVTDMELREVLIQGDDEMRREMLWQLGFWAKAEDEDEDWQAFVLPFLERVWPLQRVVKTTAASSALLNLAFDVPDVLFDEIVKRIEPRLTPVRHEAMMGPLDDNERKAFVEKHARSMLALLWAALDEDASTWPYGAAACLELLESDATTEKDPRVAELRRRRHRASPA
ncbi:SIR2 family protein [Luteibacter sp. 9133]|uniref:SIR2 family protein n=1 Tax=Luteibacter sp. 9133 TaxID=1500891 RepID=UPI0018CFD6C0|nr:SIR2 family protein [Luteibacter sp. 9133]